MMKNSHRILITSTIFLLLSACQTAQSTETILNTQPPVDTQQISDTPAPESTSTAVQVTQTDAGIIGEITLDMDGIAQDQMVETVAAVPANSGGPPWDILPEYRRITLQGYPVSDHLMKPQIFIYPLAGLAEYNEGAAQIATDLQALLQTQQAGEYMPFLPLFNASQVMHPQVQYLNFKNGSGVRFLTQFNQGPMPVNSFGLFYTFQGLTNDGQYYVAAVLPVTHPELPPTQQVDAQTEEDLKDYPAYMAETIAWLEQQPGDSFTPDLAQLDALIQSLEVR